MNEQVSDNEGWDEIEQFLLGNLPPEEAAAFERRLAADASLQKEVDQSRLLLLGIEEALMREKVLSFHDSADSYKPPVIKPFRRMSTAFITGIAASVIITIGLIAYIFLSTGNKNGKIYAAYFKPDAGLISSMGTTDNYSFDRGMIDYKTGEYKKAIAAWQPLLSSDVNNDTLQYFIASAYLADGREEDAIPLLEKIIAKDSGFRNEAYWYLALAWLKKGDKQKAISYAVLSQHPKKDEFIKKLRD